MPKGQNVTKGNQTGNIAQQPMQQINQGPFNRPPRIMVMAPQETIELPKPPTRNTPPPGAGWLSLFMPLFMIGIIFAIYIFVNHASGSQLTFLLPMAVFAVMSPLGNMLSLRQRGRAAQRQNRLQERRYRKVLNRLRARLQQLQEEQLRAALLTDPVPTDLEQRIVERNQLWERRPEDEDFLSVRVGRGSRPFSATITVPEVDATDTLAKEVLGLKEQFRIVEEMPCCIALPKVKSLGITGRRQDVAALTREMICQLTTLHSPEDVRILGIYPASQQADWDWLRDLPHTLPLKGWKRERLTAVGEDDANTLLNFMLEELSQRASKNAETGASNVSPLQPMALPHLVVVVHDYVEVRKHPALTHAFKLGEQLGVSVIYLVAQQQAIPSECRGIVSLQEDGTLSYAAIGTSSTNLQNVTADLVELELAMRISRSMSTVQIVHDDDDAADLPTSVRLLDLLDLAYVDQFDPEKWWGNGSAPRFGRLRVPIGMGAQGPIWLDLSENVHGPHGIIAGTTGAGKSELLQSLIVGLALTHHPHLVNFVLVDFKGGAAFKPFEKIPHTVGMVTDLSGKLTERALLALKSELRRREHVLSQANAKKIAEYQAMRLQNPQAYEPLPNLFIVIDEFAELAKEHPAFMEGLVSVVQKGRSLGVHLILATQKPTGSVNANIWSNLKFRICLRVASLQDSRDMLGRSEAALLPSTIPGRAYFQIGSEVFELFQGARISMRARALNEAVVVARQKNIGAGEVTDMDVLMGALEPYQMTLGPTLFKPWPAPLPARVALNDIYRQVNQFYAIAPGSKQPPYGWLTVPVGLLDLPIEQRQEPWLLDLPRNGGHVLIAGASGTGKSVFLRTLITSFVRTHAPSQLHLYLIDFGGQALRVFEGLPHVGGVFGEGDNEYILRLLRKLQGMIDERKQFCMQHQLDDFLAYQRRRLEDANLGDLPAVVLVIDKFLEFKQAHDKEMEQLVTIARHGRTYGVYLVLTADRPVSVPTQLMSLIELRIGLRLLETTDSLILLGKYEAAHIESALPGRGYKRSKQLEEVQIALPTVGEDDDEQTRLLEEMVATFVKVGRIPASMHAPAIRLLPEYVRCDYFLMDAVSSMPGKGRAVRPHTNTLQIRLGIEDFSLRPIALDLNADTPHVVVAGGPGSGRTNVLHTILFMLATPENRQAQVTMVDLRRSSRLLRRLPCIHMYADTEERLAEAVEALKKELRARVIHLHDELERLRDDTDAVIGAQLAPLVLIIDDYDQLSTLTKNPLNDLKEFLLKARDLRFHLIIAGPPNDLMRGDPLLQQARASRVGVILGGDPADQQVLGVRFTDQPVGRGYLVKRNQKYLVQVAHLVAQAQQEWVNRLLQASIVRENKQFVPTGLDPSR